MWKIIYLHGFEVSITQNYDTVQPFYLLSVSKYVMSLSDLKTKNFTKGNKNYFPFHLRCASVFLYIESTKNTSLTLPDNFLPVEKRVSLYQLIYNKKKIIFLEPIDQLWFVKIVHNWKQFNGST